MMYSLILSLIAVVVVSIIFKFLIRSLGKGDWGFGVRAFQKEPILLQK